MIRGFDLAPLPGTAGPTTGIGLENMRHVISIHDVVSDTMHQFAPTYHDYVLYSNGGGKEAPKTVRALPLSLPRATSQLLQKQCVMAPMAPVQNR